jgi:hypothetical protein
VTDYSRPGSYPSQVFPPLRGGRGENFGDVDVFPGKHGENSGGKTPHAKTENEREKTPPPSPSPIEKAAPSLSSVLAENLSADDPPFGCLDCGAAALNLSFLCEACWNALDAQRKARRGAIDGDPYALRPLPARPPSALSVPPGEAFAAARVRFRKEP